MNIRLDLHRTFTKVKEPPASDDDVADVDWEVWIGRKSAELEWHEVLSNRVSIVIAEAGMGKTFEFQDQANRLRNTDINAFFIALNRVTSVDAFTLALESQFEDFNNWLASGQPGFFFLDSVDEARLISPAAYTTSLSCIAHVLLPFLKRVSFVVSSRISDWYLQSVRDVTKAQLVDPLNDALKNDRTITCDEDSDTATEADASKPCVIEVFQLSPLSESEAQRLAKEHGATPVEELWRHVLDGDYQRMATRPRDLEWMAKRWVQKKAFGTYSELLEGSIENRLTEQNDSYVISLRLSPQELREGAEALAAASIFSGMQFVSTAGELSNPSLVWPNDVLKTWDIEMQRRLLGSALFDTGTFGRFKFQHSTREYLAAQWVAKQLIEGLPLDQAIDLFVGKPYGIPVVLKSRRSSFCWLAAFNTSIREYVIESFPELLMFEGDPECWSDAEVDLAFRGYVKRLNTGYQPNWWNDASELRRVARKLSSETMNEHLQVCRDIPKISSRLLSIVEFGQLSGCAETVFRVYKHAVNVGDGRLMRNCMAALAAVGTNAHRESIRHHLIKKKFPTSDLMASALIVVGLGKLTTSDLMDIFNRATPESEFGGGDMTQTVSGELLQKADHYGILKLIEAMFKSLTPLPSARTYCTTQIPDRDKWKIHVLADCMVRAFAKLDADGSDAADLLIEVACYLERVKHSLERDDEFQHLRQRIESKPVFRQRLITAMLARSEANQTGHLLWEDGLIYIRGTEIDWLIEQATRSDLNEPGRNQFFQLSVDLTFREFEITQREALLNTLLKKSGKAKKARSEYINNTRIGIQNAVREKQKWDNESVNRKIEQAASTKENKRHLMEQLETIRNGSNFAAIRWLAQFCANKNSRTRYTSVSVTHAGKEFGSDIERAFDTGLALIWRNIEAPNLFDFPSNQVPWAGLVGLASINHAFIRGLKIEDLGDADVTKIIRMCVWELDAPPDWFNSMARLRNAEVTRTLMPWFEQELRTVTEDTTISRTVDLVLHATEELKRPFLWRGMEMLKSKQIPGDRMQSRIFREAKEIGLIVKSVIKELVTERLSASNSEVPIEAKRRWLAEWLTYDLAEAWSWIRSHPDGDSSQQRAIAICVAKLLSDSKWAEQLAGSPDDIGILVSMYELLTPHVDSEPASDGEGDTYWSSVRRLRDSIPQIISSLSGPSAHQGLETLKDKSMYPAQTEWIRSLIIEHSAADAERESSISPRDIDHVGEIYCREPRTEQELFLQVSARLREIRVNLEHGPFSDRVLFQAGMEEKRLQLWLAARLNDTPRRKFAARFGVVREPQVDMDKRTDIEVTTRGFKVCIEIKPVDKKRYTAADLVETLKKQLVGRYMKGGQNSRNGILVLFRLDTKKWAIRKMKRLEPFPELVKFLLAESTKIRSGNHQIQSLDVFGIDCVESNPV